jgi:hypothetical protein
MMAAVAPKRYATLPRLAEGGTVVCLAPGPSLTLADAEYCRGKAVVIAINDAVEAAPWADVLYSSDSGWWIRQKGRPDFQGLRVTVGSRPQGFNGHIEAFDDLLVLRLLKENGVSFDPKGIATAANSGGAAINVAVHLGAKKVVLVGYDLGPSGRRYHFNDPPSGGQKPGSQYEAFRARISTMAEPLKAAGIDVVNCSRKTRLEAFRRQPLEAVL